MIRRPTIGEQAPAIELRSGDGSTWRLMEQRGTTQVLIFHRHIH